jgi:carotenoid 1,2-hydratase
VGSVFSPSYYRARRSELHPDPLRHCGINIAIYGARDRRWVFTEPAYDSIDRSVDRFVLGGTELAWSGDELTVGFDERTALLGRRVRGVVRLRARRRFSETIPLARTRAHAWWPIAPFAHLDVDLAQPRLRFTGKGYLDSNFGTGPLEHAFVGWRWSRDSDRTGTRVLYDVTTIDGRREELGRRFRADGTVEALCEPTLEHVLPSTRWGVARSVRVPRTGRAGLIETLEDTPFYARSLVDLGRDAPAPAVHEALDLRRFCKPWVQTMLPFRIRRGWRA